METVKKEPYNWSKYDRTGNTAIDLVAQAVGYHRKVRKPIKAVRLKASYYDLFKAGIEVLSKQRFTDVATEMFFDGVKVTRGSNMQFDSLTCEYYG
jgi:hypothetical protein